MALYSIINSEFVNIINKYNSYCINRHCCIILKMLFFGQKSLLFFFSKLLFFFFLNNHYSKIYEGLACLLRFPRSKHDLIVSMISLKSN